MDLEEFLADVGTLCTCDRCGDLCKVAATRNPQARVMRKAARPKGYCVNCAMTAWLRSIEPLPTILAKTGPTMLLVPHIQAQVYAVLTAANADAQPDEIDWRKVIDDWDLPLVKQAGAA